MEMHKPIDVLILAFYVGLIFVMVRPGSQGPKLVDSFTTGLVNLAKAVTGGGTWSDK